MTEKTDPSPLGILLILGLCIFLPIATFAVINLSQVHTTITNITITEKYPAHTYIENYGRYQSVVTDPPSVVDERGYVYGVMSQQLWGMLKVNNTYQVRYFKSSSDTYKYSIDGAVINGTAWILT